MQDGRHSHLGDVTKAHRVQPKQAGQGPVKVRKQKAEREKAGWQTDGWGGIHLSPQHLETKAGGLQHQPRLWRNPASKERQMCPVKVKKIQPLRRKANINETDSYLDKQWTVEINRKKKFKCVNNDKNQRRCQDSTTEVAWLFCGGGAWCPHTAVTQPHREAGPLP